MTTLKQLSKDQAAELERDIETMYSNIKWLKEIICQSDSRLKVDADLSVVNAKIDVIAGMATWQREQIAIAINQHIIEKPEKH